MTNLCFVLPESSPVRLTVFDLAGQEIRLLLNNHLMAGKHVAKWDHKDNHGNMIDRGIYFYRLDSRSFHSVRKLITT